jgi:hypothetical protein
MIFAIVTAILAYQRAKEGGRNGWVWAIVGAVVYVGTQLLVGLAAGVFLGFGVALLGWSESVFEDYEILITLLGLGGAIAASWLLIKFLSRIHYEEPIMMPSPPPPPRSFGEIPGTPEEKFHSNPPDPQ